MGSNRRFAGFAAGRNRGGASAVRARTRVPGAATGGTPGSANRRVHFVPFHQRIRAAPSGSGYQPAGATGGGSSALRGSGRPPGTRAAGSFSTGTRRAAAGGRRVRAGATLTRTGPTSVLARIAIPGSCPDQAALSSRIAISGGAATRTGGPHAPAPRLV
ncbi:Uncharacterised protein [Tsukamurella paurometabola]|uniref:Uncharacterized protein n=1 Tax=Tsukamurella paurometabola TaxID=2061 RepID=A0A3P8KNM1_TSUPA|nr:Uncharacterised protein [Tsukamurella paurometabola]